MPHAIEGAGLADTHKVGFTLLCGLLVFFVLEKLVLWRHCHQDICEGHVPHDHQRAAASASLILIGDGFHNVLDGVLIAAAFMTDVHLGIVTALAVTAHEIPQEVGDLAILLHSGMSRARAMTLNLLTSVTSVIGGILAYFLLADITSVLPYALVKGHRRSGNLGWTTEKVQIESRYLNSQAISASPCDPFACHVDKKKNAANQLRC